jgi:hypothetical protein
LVATLPGCELFWSWDGIGHGGDGSADSSAPDSFSSDAGAIGTACASPTALLCDDFEDDDRNNPWQPQAYVIGAGAVGLDTTHSRSGSHALHARADNRQPSAGIWAQWWQLLPSVAGPVYLRVFVYPTNPLAGFESFAEFMQTDNNVLAALYMDPQSVGWINSATAGPSSTLDVQSTLPTDRWSCVELEVDQPSSVGKAWINGVEYPPGGTSGTLDVSGVALPTPNQVNIGIYVDHGTSQVYDLWLDDVVVDTRPVGCQ